jgi:hypothetical protein
MRKSAMLSRLLPRSFRRMLKDRLGVPSMAWSLRKKCEEKMGSGLEMTYSEG